MSYSSLTYCSCIWC